jgi:NAD(P)-dependent dehydrogenase (short-subunit alcohol dehydrogenase family)
MPRTHAEMHGQVALVTGATAGLGLHVAAALARQGGRVLVAGRSNERGREAVARMKARPGGGSVELLAADASVIAENVRLAGEVARSTDHLDVLAERVIAQRPRGER